MIRTHIRCFSDSGFARQHYLGFPESLKLLFVFTEREGRHMVVDRKVPWDPWEIVEGSCRSIRKSMRHNDFHDCHFWDRGFDELPHV